MDAGRAGEGGPDVMVMRPRREPRGSWEKLLRSDSRRIRYLKRRRNYSRSMSRNRSTHRGATTVTTDQYHYLGDWVLRHHPATGQSEVVVRGPVAKHCIPASVLDPKRLIFYGGTAWQKWDDAQNDTLTLEVLDATGAPRLVSCRSPRPAW